MLTINNLTISFIKNNQYFDVIRKLNLNIKAGEILGIVGESGSGKSLTNLALMGLLPENARVSANQFQYKQHNLLSLTKKSWQSLRGNEIAMIFQNPKAALNPTLKIKNQFIEILKTKTFGLNDKFMEAKACFLLDRVGLHHTKQILEKYPHELSGGMAQRVMIAMAIATNPSLLIADEPTTGLDPANKEHVLTLLNELRMEKNMAIILVSHDINVIEKYSDRINVMYSGELMETGSTSDVFCSPKHPYTQGLINCLPNKNQGLKKVHLNTIEGYVLPITEKVKGCRFYNRCPHANPECQIKPELKNNVACHRERINEA